MFRRNFIYVLGALFLTAGGLLAQQPPVEARIAGLENNEEYMSLLREDARLQEREDSIVNAVAVLRERLREDPVQRQRYSQEILQLESRIFEIRNAKGRLIDRINTIEQEWVLANLDGAVQTPATSGDGAVVSIPDSVKVRNLVDNLYFREHLAEADYAALCKAQRLEYLRMGEIWRGGEPGKGTQYIFATAMGTPTDRHGIARALRAYLDKAGLEHRGPHALRHTFATRWIQSGKDPVTLSKILGHANVSFTLKTYVHADTASKRAGMETMATII